MTQTNGRMPPFQCEIQWPGTPGSLSNCSGRLNPSFHYCAVIYHSQHFFDIFGFVSKHICLIYPKDSTPRQCLLLKMNHKVLPRGWIYIQFWTDHWFGSPQDHFWVLRTQIATHFLYLDFTWFTLRDFCPSALCWRRGHNNASFTFF